jgi:RNA polymerase sigma-70 factor (sigma-E family)
VTDDGQQSFAEFVTREQGGLLRLAYLLAGDRGHAEDLVQTALMKTYRHWNRITQRGEPGAYVRRVLVTTHTSWRRRAVHREQTMEMPPEVAAPERSSRADDAGLLQAALRSLPARMRATLVLRYFEDLSEQQTARLLGCSVSTVSTQTARGLARLRQALASESSGDDVFSGIAAATSGEAQR